MSGFISSLLIQIGIRSPLPPQPSSQPNDDQAKSHLSEPTNPPSDSKDHKFVSPRGQDHRQKSNCGDAGAGSLHSPPFFTTLPKEMDGRNLQPEGTRSVTHNTPGSIQNIAATTDGSFDPTNEIDVSLQPDSSGNSQASHPSDALNSHNEPQYAASAIAIGEPRRSLDDAFDPEGLARSSLPADDGMGVLRSKIIAIRELRLTNVEKARMVHGLMTEGYNSSRELPSIPGMGVFSTPSSPPSLELPTSLRTPQTSEINTSRPGSPYSESVPLYESTFNLTPEDLQPTFVPKTETEPPEIETGDEDGDTEEQEETTLGCVHYHRNVKLECHTCKKWYTCRFCHDEVEDHSLVRRDTENMLCMLCGHAQPAAQNCSRCSEQTAQYYCEICKLWDNDSKKSIYHCSDCGICRIGQGLGKDFFHCQVRAPT